MKEGKKKRSLPPPLPDVAAANGEPVEPPPIVDGTVDEKPVDDQPVAPADPIAEFLSRAGAVLALERGMNPRSRIKLAAIAEELELSDDDFDTVMEQLLGGESKAQTQKELSRDELKQLRRQKRKFHDHVGNTLMALPHGVLTSSMEQMLVEDGVRDHGFSREDAQAEIVQLAKKLNIRRISREEANRHVAELADYALKPNGMLPPDVRDRIIAEASRWGLTPDQVEPILRERTSRIRMGERKDQTRMVMLISASAAVLVGVLGMIAWMAFSNALPDPPREVATAEEADEAVDEAPVDGSESDSTDPPATAATPTRLSFPKWWNTRASTAAATLYIPRETLKEKFYRLGSSSAEERIAVYDELLDVNRGLELSAVERSNWAEFMGACYAVDPDDACAAHLRDSWMNLLTAASNELPSDVARYSQALWVADAAFWSLAAKELSDGRRDDLLDALERTCQASFDREQPLQPQINEAVATTVYQSLIRNAMDEVDVAVDLHKQLLAKIGRDLPADTSNRLAAEYLREVLPHLGDRWGMYEDLIRRAAMSEDPLNVVLMVEVFEESENKELQGYLGAQLLLRSGLSRTARYTPEELASQVREALGVRAPTRPIDMSRRVAQWREAVEEQLGRPVPESENTKALLQDMIDSARLSTLGVALARGELAEAEFNALWEAKPPSLDKSSTGTGPPRNRRVNTSTLKNLSRNIDALGGFRRMEKGRRYGVLQSISSYSTTVTDVQPQQGQVIASYLAAAKPVDEHERIMSDVDKVLRWRMVRMALADEIAESRLRTAHLGELVGKALRKEVDVEEDGWRGRLRDELLASVARELETEISLSAESMDIADRAAQILTSYYRTQAKLRGAQASAYNSANSPSQILLLLIQQAAAELSAGSASPQERTALEAIPHELIAVDYLADSDLARTAHLQRLWQQLLRMEMKTAPSDDLAANGLLQQVAQGERELLKLWLQRNK